MTSEPKPPPDETPDETPDQGEPHPWEAQIDTYPTRAPEDDPRWAIRVVMVWTTIAIALLVFIVALIILGLFFD